MKMNLKKKSILILTTVILCLAVLFTSCGEKEPESTEAAYTVTVKDALGTPYTSGVIVKFMQAGEQVAMQVVNEEGIVSKTLEKGDYTVELMFTSGEEQYHYNKEGLTLSEDKTTLDVVVSQAMNAEGTTLFAQSKETTAHRVSAGCTYVTLTAGERNYFLFTPDQEGTYEFSVPGSTAVIGYYGAPHFVQELSAAEVKDNKFTISVSASMIGAGDAGTSVLVIGVDAGAEDTDCILAIERKGPAEKTLADEPWHVYKTTTPPTPYVLSAGATLAEFDLTAATSTYKLVLNTTDGFYHLDSENGPLVLVRLTEDSKYLASYKTILESTRVGKYFFDEQENFVKKESYVECLLEYIPCADENKGVYPLTEDLKYIIQQSGDYLDWWNTEASTYIFKDEGGTMVPGINSEIAWLFMCCYIAA